MITRKYLGHSLRR